MGSTLEKKLFLSQKSGWLRTAEDEQKFAFALAEEYKEFLSKSKTEREFTKNAIAFAESKGFKPATTKKKLKSGDKVYFVNNHKNVVLVVLGKQDLLYGTNIVAAHMDSPRIDIKQNPLYESKELALLDTHYYGGIKKYQWVNIPLSLHGVVFLANGKEIEIHIGEDPKDPVFVVPDLLPHLAVKQMEKKAAKVVEGEALNIVVGSIPVTDKDVKEKIKLQVLKTLHDKYGIVEEDFVSAELEAVPAFTPRDVGIDRSLVGAYGQDDKICSFATLHAIADLKTPQRTAICYLVDKEEIGSDGNTGAKSNFLSFVLLNLLKLSGHKATMDELTEVLRNSDALSADVNSVINPMYTDVYEAKNAAKIGHGIVLTKFTGSGGKYSANDANAEFVFKIRQLLNKHKVVWQAAELGKVDIGGGGTIAKYLAQQGINVIDLGPGVLSMHSPFEISSKIDLYHSYKAYKVFMEYDS